MSHQSVLFYEDIYDALRAAIQVAGGAKAVASKLWPAKPTADAHRELLDALNRERPRKLDPEEVIAILRMAKDADFHAAKFWLDDALGYEQGKPVTLAEETDRAAAALAEAAGDLRSALEALERLQSRNRGLASVKS